MEVRRSGLWAPDAIRHFKNEKGTGAEMRPANVPGDASASQETESLGSVK